MTKCKKKIEFTKETANKISNFVVLQNITIVIFQ